MPSLQPADARRDGHRTSLLITSVYRESANRDFDHNQP